MPLLYSRSYRQAEDVFLPILKKNMLGVKKFSNSEVSYKFHTRICDFYDKIQCEGVDLESEKEILRRHS